MSLAQKAARGALWTVISSMGGRAIGVIGTLVITRFLHPSQIGEVAAATVLEPGPHRRPSRRRRRR
jgi:PST family polysaccharide transporter